MQPSIVFFNRSFYPETSAVAQLLTELCDGLVREHGCRVAVIAGYPFVSSDGHSVCERRGIVKREFFRGIEILRSRGTTFSKTSFAGRASNYVSYFLSACVAGLRLSRPDVVVALTDPPVIGLAALAVARRFGARFVFLCQDVFPEVAQLQGNFHSKAVKRILDWINRFLIRKADWVIAIGETMGKRLITDKGAEPQKTMVIHNWADCSAIIPGPKGNAFSEEHGLMSKFVVMHSGNIGMSQGLEIIVQAAAHLRQYEDIRIVCVGDGVTKPALEERVRAMGLKNILFLPYQPKERLAESFAAADVFVISLKQGLAGYIVPSKLYGILAAGRPYVAAVEEACEITAITKQYNCGLVVEPGDAEDLARKILILYHDRNLTQRLGANARQAALKFDRPVQVRAYYDLFRGLACAP